MPRIIDFETHVQATEYVDLIASYNGYPRYANDERGRFTWYVSPNVYETRDGLRDKLENVNTRLAEMDKQRHDSRVFSQAPWQIHRTRFTPASGHPGIS